MAETPFSSNRIAQVAFVVRSLDEAIPRWSAQLGSEPNAVVETAPGLENGQVYRGEPSDARCRLAFFEAPNIQIELIEPDGQPSAWQEVLDRNGEGLHHVAWWVEDIDEAAAVIPGSEPVMRARMGGGGEFAYFQTPNGMVELLCRKNPA
jgi:catechol 2,3-dioxygenase-like lactoylglutathione lyase family enzyme